MNFLMKLSILMIYALSSIVFSFLFPDLRLEIVFIFSLVLSGVFAYFFPQVQWVVASLLAAHLIFLSFPDMDYEFLMFFAFIPLFLVVEKVKSNRSLFFYGVLAGIMTLTGGFYWLNGTIVDFGHFPQHIALPIFVAYTFAFSLKFPIIMLGLSWMRKHLDVSRLITFPLIITLADFLIYELFPWYFGNSQYNNTYFIQIAELTGVIGITYVIAFMNTLIFEVYVSVRDRSVFPVKGLIVGTLMIIGVYTFGFMRVSQIEGAMKKAQPITVSVVQPNTPMGGTRDPKAVLNTLRRLSLKALENNKIDLLVWPESAASFSYRWGRMSPVSELITHLAKKYKVHIFFGDLDWDFKGPQNNKRRLFNSAHLISPGLDLSAPYHKIYLLPFGEYIPLGDWFPSIYEKVEHVGHFTHGDSIEVFDFPKARLVPQICYEVLVPSFTRRFIKKGGEVIINITNDMWFGKTKASKLHLAHALFRAIENRVPIVRCTNTGISTFVDSVGRIASRQTPLYQPDVLTHTIYPPKIRSLYLSVADLASLFYEPEFEKDSVPGRLFNTILFQNENPLFGLIILLAGLFLIIFREKVNDWV
ncbi:MAG: apolipoprotein N-acyltransferase [bacterium]|nr:MAG: apolipoprotein N-acyltransferase [bacterium]